MTRTWWEGQAAQPVARPQHSGTSHRRAFVDVKGKSKRKCFAEAVNERLELLEEMKTPDVDFTHARWPCLLDCSKSKFVIAV